MWKITKTQEEKEHEKADKEMIAFYKILPLEQKLRANLALIHGRIEALEQTTIIPKQTTKIVESCEVQETTKSTPTQKVNAKVANTKRRMSQSKVSKKYKNAKGEDMIGFEKNTLNNFSHAKTGDVDGKFTAFAELSEWLVVSPNPRKKTENRIFFNFIEEELKSDFIKVAKREGFEVSFN